MRVTASMVWRIAPVLLLASTVAAAAAPLVPARDQGGRERPLHAIAARPLHGAEPTGEAAVALGLRRAPIVARQGALPAKPELLSGMHGGPGARCLYFSCYLQDGREIEAVIRFTCCGRIGCAT